MKPFRLIAALALVAGIARAAPITSYPSATTPLSGAESLIGTQGASTRQFTVNQLAQFATVSVASFGAVGNGVADDTVAIQAAFASGKSLTCSGTYKLSATINVTAAGNGGQRLVGTGPTGAGGTPTAGRCIFKPTSAVTTAFLIDGTGIGGYITGVEISDLTLDMTDMAVGTKGFKQGQSFDIRFERVRVTGDTDKTGFYLGPGAFVTMLDTVQANAVQCIGTGVQNPTTLTLTNPDITKLNASQCANVTTVGGAIQSGYSAGHTTVQYVASGDTNMLGFYETVAAFNADNGTTGGFYMALGSYFDAAQNIMSSGTDWEALAGNPGNACTPLTGGGTWGFGTYNDGTNGCHPIVWVISVSSTVRGCAFDVPVFGGEYLYSPQINGCTIRGYTIAGNNSMTFDRTIQIFDSSVVMNRGAAFLGFSNDVNGSAPAQTFTLDASTGGIAVATEAVTPPNDNLNFVDWFNHGGQQIGGVAAQATVANSSLFVTNGASIIAYDNLGASRASMSGSTGAIIGNEIKAQPKTVAASNAFLVIDPTNSSQTINCGTASAAPIGDSGCNLANGANLNWFSDGFSTKQASVNGATGAASFKATTATTFSATTNLQMNGRVAVSATAPTYSSGFSTGTPSIAGAATNAFTVTISTTPQATGVLTMPTATTGWACNGADRTTAAGTIRETGTTTTSVTFALASTVASDVLQFTCQGY